MGKVLFRVGLFLIVLTSLSGCAKYLASYYTPIAQAIPFQQPQGPVFTVATFNAGILYGYIMGRKFFEPTPYSDKRLQLIPTYVRTFDVDVIGFQELYRTEDKLYLVEQLKDLYPYAVYYHKVNDFGVGLHNGELFLSKLPILESAFSLFHRNVITEKIGADKGMLSIIVPWGERRIAITNVHTTVGGGLRDTEAPKTNAIRNRQLIQALTATDAMDADIKIILGDFNAGPNVSAINHQLMLDHHYLDTYQEIYEEDEDCVTWHPRNVLNFNGYFPTSPPQRIDNIFINKAAQHLYTVLEADVMLRDEVLEENGLRMPLSDHYGYYCRIRID